MSEAELQERLDRALAEREKLKIEAEVEQQRFKSLTVKLEDMHAAVVGYQMDCSKLNVRSRELEDLVVIFQRQCSATRVKIVESCRDEVALKQALENIASRCTLLKDCESELRATGAVKNQETIRFLRHHLREAVNEKRDSTTSLAQLRRKCTSLTSKSRELVARLTSACASEDDAGTSAAAGNVVKPRLAPRLAPARRTPRTTTPALQLSSELSDIIQPGTTTDARKSSASSQRSSACKTSADSEEILPIRRSSIIPSIDCSSPDILQTGSIPSVPKDLQSCSSKPSRPPLPPMQLARKREDHRSTTFYDPASLWEAAVRQFDQRKASSGAMSDSSTRCLLIESRRAELEANQVHLETAVRSLEALHVKIGGLKDFLSEVCREGPNGGTWSPGLPEHIEASLLPLLEELRRYHAPDVLDGSSQTPNGLAVATAAVSSCVGNGLDTSI